MPVVWLIDAYRAGERGQVRALVDALGYPCETKTLEYRTSRFMPHVLGRATLDGIEPGSRAQLRPPWPDLVVSCGVRNEPVCRWIREQSGGRSRYVHVGRPWGPLEQFDLVITTPQYRVAEAPNVLRNPLTLHSLDAARLALARSEWQPVFAALPQPRIAVLAGGDSGPFTLGPKAAARLGREVSAQAADSGGSLLVTTSSRTRASAVEALQLELRQPAHFHRWRAGDTANPYVGMLAWADRIVVTGDSIAMLSEACATGVPVQMFDLGGMRADHPVDRDFRLGGSLYAGLLRWGWAPLTRDITEVHRQLRESGRVNWLDEAPPASGADSGASDLERSVAAVRSLLGEA
ncbi:mitochondrial fission ELM1 family protein [Mangrovimicrobium sediminis]|nr:mitochondrial fission ELM1 family protein [Haliea sp. SAOS-164]